MDTDPNGLEVLTRDECIQMLKKRSFGRLGLSVDALPTILPVNFSLIDDQIIIRTKRGAKLATATRNAPVAFEVDHIDNSTGNGWSVVVRGFARELAETEYDRVNNHPATPRRLSVDHCRLVSISLDLISGRRTHFSPACNRGLVCAPVGSVMTRKV